MLFFGVEEEIEEMRGRKRMEERKKGKMKDMNDDF